MSDWRTEWWRRASRTLDDAEFKYQLRQVHGLASLSEYAPDAQRARSAIAFTHLPDKLYNTAIQIFMAASLEVSSGTPITDQEVSAALRTVARLLYFLYLGDGKRFQEEHLLLRAALAFDLAGYAANGVATLKLRDRLEGPPQATDAPDPSLVAYLLLGRRIPELRSLAREWEASISADTAPGLPLAHVDTLSALSEFIVSGNPAEYTQAAEHARRAARMELEVGTTQNWYLARGFELLIQRLRDTSVWLALREALGELTPVWRAYIRNLALGTGRPVPSPILGKPVPRSSVVDLWPSQLHALRRGFLGPGPNDTVVRMPTSAGKTRLAEFAILKALSERPESVCVYIVPFVALANETRETLRETLGGIGLRVSDLFHGEYELTDLDQQVLKRNDVVICTPEKLDLMIRRSVDFLQRVHLFVFDEGHMIDESARGVRYEFLIERLRRYRHRAQAGFRILIMSAVVPNAGDLAEWVSGTRDGLLDTEWRPTEVRFGVFHWHRGGTRGDINYPAQVVGEEGYYVPGVIYRRILKTQYYPSTKSEICAELARTLVHAGPVVVFAATKPFVRGIVHATQKLVAGSGTTLPIPEGRGHRERLRTAFTVCQEYLGDGHDLVTALRQGFAYHTGDLPQSIRAQVEELYQAGTISVLICTSTLGQGVNLPVKSLVVHSLFRGGTAQRISSREFMNIAGRTARALRQMEGQVVFVHSDHRASFLKCEREVQNLSSLEGHVISSIMLLYAHLARTRGEIAADAGTRRFLRKLVSVRRLGRDVSGSFDDGLTALDGQLLAMLVEEGIESDALDAAKILGGSLFDVQSRTYGVNALPIYADMTHRMVRIAMDLQDEAVRQRFFRTGLRPEGCRALLEASHLFLDRLEAAPDALEDGADVIRAAFEVCIMADETKPRPDAARISDLFPHFWSWIRGVPVREMSREKGITAELLSRTIEDLFVRKVPWGINSLYILAEHDIKKRRDPLPGYLRHLPTLARYGVPTPEAAICRAIGVSGRTSAIRLARAYPHRNKPVMIDQLLDWVAGLSRDDLHSIVGNNEAALRAYDEINQAQLGNPGARKFERVGWDNVEVRALSRHADSETIRAVAPGDELLMVREPDNPADPNAIQVLLTEERVMVGYLAREYARLVAPLLDGNIAMRATVVNITPASPAYPFGRLYVNVAEA